MLKNFRNTKARPNNLLSLLALIALLVLVEVLLSFQLLQRTNLIIIALAGLIFIIIASTKLSDITLYSLIFLPPVLVPLINIKYGEIFPLEFCIGILLILWLLKLLTSKTLYPRDMPLLRPFMALALIGIISTLNSYIFWDLSITLAHRSLFIQLADIGLKLLPISLIFLAYLVSDNTESIKKFHKIFLGLGFLHILAPMLPFQTRAFSFDALQAISIFSLALATLLFYRKNLSSLKYNILLFTTLGLLLVIASVTHLATLACLFISTLTISFVRSRKLFAVLLVILIVFSFLNFGLWINLYKLAESEGSLTRIPIAYTALEIFRTHPVLGVGPANYYSYAITHNVGWEFWRIPMANIHNNYLEILTEMGLFGFSILMWLIIKTFKELSKSFFLVKDTLQKTFIASAIGNFAGFVVMSIAGSFLLPGVHSGEFLYFNRAAYMWILVGIALSLPRLIKKEPEDTESENIND